MAADAAAPTMDLTRARIPPLQPKPGSYALLLRPSTSGWVTIGRLGTLTLNGGCLIYVGSAQGPGGVAARCRHHLLARAKPHWHLDYLRPHCRVIGIWVHYGTTNLEHDWARALATLPGATHPLPRFGASDCSRCPAHLARLPRCPSARTMRRCFADGRLIRLQDTD